MGFAAKHLGENQRAEIARTLFTVTSTEEAKGELHGLCPLHGEKNPSFAYNYKKDVYNCLSCGAGGDLLRLWMEVRGVGQKEGFRAFCEEYGISADSPGGEQKRRGVPGGGGGREDEAGELDPELVMAQMEKALESYPPLPDGYIKRLTELRGWSAEWVEILDLRLQTSFLTKKGTLANIDQPDRVAIPVRDRTGALVNIRLYRPGAKQYKIISFAKSSGMSRLFPSAPLLNPDSKAGAGGVVVLCEGESDTICALSHGFNAITQTSKLKNFPQEQLAVFAGRDVVIAYDADQPGQKYARYAAQALAGTAASIRTIEWPAYMGVDENGGVPADHGQDLTDFFVRHKRTADDFEALINAAVRPVYPTGGIDSAPVTASGDDATKDMPAHPPGDIVAVRDFFEMGVNNRFSFKPRLLAERLLAEYKLMSDPATGTMYLWNGKYWEEFDEDHLKNVAIRYLANEAQKSRVEDAIFQVRKLVTLPHGRRVNDRLDWICLQNGMLNINTFEIVPHDPDAYFTTIFPVALDPSSSKRCELFLQYLDTNIRTPEVIDQVQEFAGYILTRHARYEKCLFLYGPGRDGKSTLMKLLREMVGALNCSAVSFPDLEREFPRSSLYNKLLNISTEIGSQAIESSYFKAITSGDPIQAAFKHKDNFEFNPYCKLIFAGNILPRIKDTSDALYERFLPIRFKRQFLEGDPQRDPMLLEKLKGELSEIFYWALCGLQRLMKNGRFTDCDETRELLMRYRRSNSPILSFVEDVCVVGEDKEVLKDDLYGSYRQYCGANGYMPTSNNNFFRELENAVNNLRVYRPRVDGDRKRVIQGVALKGEFQ